MNDSLLMRCLQPSRDLRANFHRLFNSQGTMIEALRQRLAWHVLEHKACNAFVRLNAINLCNVRMIQLRQRLRFTLEALEAIVVRRKFLRQRLNGDESVQPRVPR